jgi:hypothetical protein
MCGKEPLQSLSATHAPFATHATSRGTLAHDEPQTEKHVSVEFSL